MPARTQAHPDDLASDPFIVYACDMVGYLSKRLNDAPPPLSLSLAGSEGAGPEASGGANGVGSSLGGVHGKASVQDGAALGGIAGTLEEGRM